VEIITSMPSLIGYFPYTVDNKGRLNIPAELRRELPGSASFVLIPGLDHCIFVFPENEWEQIDQRLQSLSFSRTKERLIQRFIYAQAARRRCDDQGRIAVPTKLLEYAGINRDAVVLGVSNRIEIWNPETYTAYISKELISYEQLIEEVMMAPQPPAKPNAPEAPGS
jgi:MraZ protein